MSVERLNHTFRRIARLNELSAICGWDEAVNMPAGAGARRAEALAEVAVLRTELLQSPALADAFAATESEAPVGDSMDAASFREMKRVWMQATAVPVDLVEAKSLAASACEQGWRVMRADNDWKGFRPLLEEVVRLTREEAVIRAEKTGLSQYDALLELYEPGGRHERITALFDELKDFLPGLIEAAMERQSSQSVKMPDVPVPVDAQRQLGLDVMKALRFDFDHGRLDVSHHPFCGGVPSDVRITTRYREDDFVESLMGVIHETGHACYEQGLPRKWADSPVGQAVGMSTHESQSLLFEMQIGRSQPFLDFLAPMAASALGGANPDPELWSATNLFRMYTRVAPGLIRVTADEATYPAHVILRYEIEKALIEDSLEVADIPELWNEKMELMLGLSTSGNDGDGCMQDVHWPAGLIGYFPTYTLGALSAAQLYAAMDAELDDLPGQLRRGDLEQVHGWLGENVWSHGSRYMPDDLLERVTGAPLGVAAFKAHLERRYLA